jgi:hypothetical protein
LDNQGRINSIVCTLQGWQTHIHDIRDRFF